NAYRADYQDYRANRTLLSADGAGSAIMMTNAASFNGAAFGFNAFLYTVQAINGGLVDLSNVASITGSPNNGSTSALRFLVASGGTIRLDHLNTLSGRTQFDLQTPAYTFPALNSAASAQFNLTANGTVNVPKLASLSAGGVNLAG